MKSSLLLLLLAAPLAAQSGATDCEESGAVTISLSPEAARSEILSAEIVAHELVHVAQLRRTGSCKLAMEHYRASQRNAAWMEVEAYCAGWPIARQRLGGDDAAVYAQYLGYVLRSSGRFPAGDGGPRDQPLTPYDVSLMFKARCPWNLPQ